MNKISKELCKLKEMRQLAHMAGDPDYSDNWPRMSDPHKRAERDEPLPESHRTTNYNKQWEHQHDVVIERCNKLEALVRSLEERIRVLEQNKGIIDKLSSLFK